jgi:cyanophycinase
LLGSGEFEPWSADVESLALADAVGDGTVAILPTASAAEGDRVFDRWGAMGLDHYAEAGVPAAVVQVKVRDDAFRDDVVEQFERASMIYFSGGKPTRLADVLRDTPLLAGILRAIDRGAVYAGCSAGAMVASRARDADARRATSWLFGLGLVPHVSFGVHWDKVKVIPGLRSLTMSRIPSGSWFVGLDERTAILGDGHRWRVYGLGSVMVRHGGGTEIHREGATFETMDRGGPPARD